MSAPVAESGEGTLDAGSASAEDVAAALGVDSPGDDEGSSDAPDEVGQEVTLESLAEIVEQQRIQIATLKREKAAERVEATKKAKVQPADQTDQVAAAVEAAKSEARLEFGVKLARSEVKAALAPVMTSEQIDTFVDRLNLASFVDDDGEVNSDEIAALKAEQVALLGKRPATKVGHGRTGAPGSKSTADQFADAFSRALAP